MDTADTWNGQVTLPAEVSFGPDQSDRMTVEWASRGLTWLKANRPQVFADMMAEGVFGIERKRPGRAKAGA